MAVEKCWNAILKKDVYGLGESFTENFEAQVELFPLMLNSLIEEKIKEYKGYFLVATQAGAAAATVDFPEELTQLRPRFTTFIARIQRAHTWNP